MAVSVSVQTCLIVSFHQPISPSSVLWNSESDAGEFFAEFFHTSTFIIDDLQAYLLLYFLVYCFPSIPFVCDLYQVVFTSLRIVTYPPVHLPMLQNVDKAYKVPQSTLTSCRLLKGY